MNAPDPLVQRITDRLAADPELRLEVARELQAHLEDCAAEFRAGGAGETEARASAEKALGDPAELADQLWRANRGRMRFRAVARWAAGAALLPAAVAVLLLLAVSLWRGCVRFYRPCADVPDEAVSGLPEEERFVLTGDPNATSFAVNAKSISDRWPQNPVYFANYLASVMGRFYRDGRPDPDKLDDLLALGSRGERLDPNNAFYTLLKATWLIQASSEVQVDPARVWEGLDAKGNTSTQPAWKVTIRDPSMFHRGLEEFRRGLAKPEYAVRTLDFAAVRSSFLPPPRRLGDVLTEAYLDLSTLMPGLSGARQLGKALAAYAVDLAARGDPSAVELARSVEVLGDQIGANSRTVIEISVAKSIRQIGLVGLEQVGKELKRDSLVAASLQDRRKLEQDLRDLQALAQVTMPHTMRHAGMLWATFMPSLPDFQADFRAVRTTEVLVFFEVSLLFLLAVLTVLAAAFGAAAIWGRVFPKAGGKPILLFVGWRRLGRIVMLSVVLPLGAYGLYAWWQTARLDAYGLNFTLDRLSAEAAVVIGAVLVLLLSTTYRAVRRRCLEVGLETPAPITPRRRWVMAVVGALAATAFLVYVVVWWTGPVREPSSKWPGIWAAPFKPLADLVSGGQESYPLLPPGAILAAPFLLLTAVWLCREWYAVMVDKAAAFRRAFFRSAMPLLCAAVIVVGLAVGGLLSLGEGLSARGTAGTGAVSFRDEIDRSDYRLLRDQFRLWHVQDSEQLVQDAPGPATGASTSATSR